MNLPRYFIWAIVDILFWSIWSSSAQNLPTLEDGGVSDLFYGSPRLPGNPLSRRYGMMSSFPCPANCICNSPASEKSCDRTVDCSGLRLSEVPEDLSPLTDCLYLSMNNISKISAESFAGLKNLKKLSLSGNVLSDLPSDVFPNFRKLHTLLLQDNFLTSIPPNTLSKMASLKDLNLGANYIRFISPNAFAKLDSLKHIWLDDNRLEEIPTRALSKAPNLEALSLDINQIQVIKNEDLKALSQMKVLLLKHNKISKIENDAFKGATSLQIVDLAFNKLTSVPPAFKSILNLQQLDLNNNSIETLPDVCFAGNPELREVAIQGNPLKSVGRTAFSGLKHLESLLIEDAEDQVSFPDLSGCSNLEELSIVGGKLKDIPLSLCSDLPSLKRLTLSRNKLRNLSGLERCHNLTYLDASGNQLSNLRSNETRSFTKLKELDLSNNRIQQLSEDAFERMSLQKLNLAYNSFTFLPVKGMGNLRELNISGVRTLLYLPPMELLSSLRSLVAFYPYHCCQLAKTSRESANELFSHQDDLAQAGIHQSPVGKPTIDATLAPIQCTPDPGPFTPCDNLLPSTPLRIFFWFSMVVAFLLNGLILLSCGVRYCVRRRSRLSGPLPSDEQMLRRVDNDSPYPSNPESRIVSDSDVIESHYCLNLSRGTGSLSSDNDCFDLALCHLAFADAIVTAYTAVILSYDHSTLGNFAEYGAWWQQSVPCHSAGFLLTFGTQLAFSTVAVMAVERYLAIRYPLQPEKHMKKTVLLLALTLAWVISLVTATVTLFGGGSQDGSRGISDMLPAQNGAACLPWTTEFPHVAVLVSLHVFVCFMVILLCIVMFCARRKQPWMSSRKSSRRQVAIAIAFNIMMILPLAIVALYVSGIMTYSDVVPGEDGGFYDRMTQYGKMVLDMGQVLAFVMFAIPMRPLLNPVLYIVFNKPLRRDISYLARKIFWGDPKPSHLLFPPQQEVLDSMYESSIDVPRSSVTDFPLFNQPVFDRSLLQRTAYDNSGIIASSSTSYPTAASVPVARSSSQNMSGSHGSDRRKRRRRSSRSRRSERRTTTDTDPTTESEVITFHRAEGVVSYNPEAHERRRKKLSVRCGGVNARDEFQRLIFPRVPMTSSSSHGSNSTIYPIRPVSRSAIMSSSRCTRPTPQCPSTSSADTPPLSRASLKQADNSQQQRKHYDLSALNSFRGREAQSPTSQEMNNNKSSYNARESRGAGHSAADTTYAADMEVAGITSTLSPDDQPFFADKDTTKRCPMESVRRKVNQGPLVREDDYHLPTREKEHKEFPPRSIALAMTRKDSAASHSSASGISDGHPVGRGGKVLGSCEYCDSSASKDSGIHSEIDSASGASYSDTSIGRRLRFSAGVGAHGAGEVSTIREREIDRFELAGSSKIQEFEIVPTQVNDPNGLCEVLNTETAI